MKKIGGFIMKLSIATTGLATMCCLTTACGKEADITPIDTSAVPNATSSIVTTAPITTTTPIITSTQQMSIDIPLTDDIIIDTTIGEDIVIVTDENVSRDTLTTSPTLTTTVTTTTAPKTTTTKKPATVTTTTTKKVTTTTTTTTTAKKTTTTTTPKLTTTQEITTTTSPTIKITQEDVDRLVDELQEYSNSKAVYATENWTEFRGYGTAYTTLDEFYEWLCEDKTPSNSSWNSPNFYTTERTYDYMLEKVKGTIDYTYSKIPNCHIVIYALYENGDGSAVDWDYNDGVAGWYIYLLR